jgi:radical SAM superfamily enzyme YgiQ (UPF0313 family)
MEKLLQLLEEYNPSIVGITATTPVYNNAREIGKRIRRRFPMLSLGLGGVHATLLRKKILEEESYFDWLVVGEGERTLVEVCNAVSLNKNFTDIQGVIWKDGVSIIENSPRPLEHELDAIYPPARNILPPELYKHYLPGRGYIQYASIFTSRGCPFQCVFCSQHTMHGRQMRWHSIDRVIEELKYIIHYMKINHVIIMDETMTLKKSRVIELCTAIKKEGLQFTFEGWTHASTIDEELLRTMKEVGLIRLSFGIESGDPDILLKIKKGVSLEQIRNAYRLAAQVGIEVRGSAIIGHPFETKASVWRTLKFIRNLKECQQIFLNVACPYPGTELYQYASSGTGGMRLLSDDFAKYTRYGDPVIEVNDLSAKDLSRLQILGLLYFYLTPRRIWYNIVKRTGLRAGLQNAWAFAKGILTRLARG